MAGSEATDMAIRALTPYDSWAEGVSDITGLPQWETAFTNPGGLGFASNANKIVEGTTNAVKSGYEAGKNLFTTFGEIKPEIGNMIADRMHLPRLKGFVDSKGNYYESRFNLRRDKTLREKLIEDGYKPYRRRGDDLVIDTDFSGKETPVNVFIRNNLNSGINETVKINPYVGDRIHLYSVSGESPVGRDLGVASVRRSSYGHNSPGSYKMGNEFDLAFPPGAQGIVDKNILKTFGAGIQRYLPKAARITGDGAPSIADRVLLNWRNKKYWDALRLAAKRPIFPTNNALSTDAYRYLVGYGGKYPGFTTFYDGYDMGFNSAGSRYLDDKELFKTAPHLLKNIYMNLDNKYPGIINGQLPHPWIKKK